MSFADGPVLARSDLDLDHHVKFYHCHLRECYDLEYFCATAGFNSRNRLDMAIW